jgi:hypothetical protein
VVTVVAAVTRIYDVFGAFYWIITHEGKKMNQDVTCVSNLTEPSSLFTSSLELEVLFACKMSGIFAKPAGKGEKMKKSMK